MIEETDNYTDYFPEIYKLYNQRDFQQLKSLFHTNPNVTIDTMNNNNDNCIAYMAAEQLDFEGIRFCIDHKSKNLSYACALTMQNYSEKPSKTLELIDLILESGAGMWNVFHRSITWGHFSINCHLYEKWHDRIDLNWLECALETAGIFGKYQTVKSIMNQKHYQSVISKHTLANCLRSAISIDSGCTENYWKLMKYLVDELKIDLTHQYPKTEINDTGDPRPVTYSLKATPIDPLNKIIMKKIRYLIDHYHDKEWKWDKYMPHLFKVRHYTGIDEWGTDWDKEGKIVTTENGIEYYISNPYEFTLSELKKIHYDYDENELEELIQEMEKDGSYIVNRDL